MKTLFFGAAVFAALALVSSGASAAAPFDGFASYATPASLKPFARDLGGILGSDAFHSGRILGFSGFDFGVHGVAQFAPESGDQIMRKNGVSAFGIPMVQAEVGMPFRFDGFVRGINYGGLTVAGGGARYALIKPRDKPWSPQLMATGLADSVTQQDFSATHFGCALVASMGTQALTPYLGAGIDWTHLLAKNSAADPSMDGESVEVVGDHFTAGVQVRPWPFFYAHLAYVFLHGSNGAEGGLGIRF